MREIKFRAFSEDLSNQKWVYGSLVYDRDEVPRILTNAKESLFTTCFKGSEGQFTGLKDKNRKEIYEGDIMYLAGIGNCEVTFINGTFGLLNKNDFTAFCEDYEQDLINKVIGNIYENPECVKSELKE